MSKVKVPPIVIVETDTHIIYPDVPMLEKIKEAREEAGHIFQFIEFMTEEKGIRYGMLHEAGWVCAAPKYRGKRYSDEDFRQMVHEDLVVLANPHRPFDQDYVDPETREEWSHEREYFETYSTHCRNTKKLIYEHLGLDADQEDRERDAVLNAVQRSNETKKPLMTKEDIAKAAAKVATVPPTTPAEEPHGQS